ncbi:MAG: adenosylcobinamide-GDP ribazoletransferase [Treponema sp.]|jgi:adenosylcobinamide-GDP ribazoletransferase|nr:adenosylcobinamide-GDP ribazoletransferase [Treponema sp.]
MFDRFFSTLSVVSRIPAPRFKFDPSRMDFYLPLTGLCPALPGLLIFAGFSLLCKNPAPAGIPALAAALILIAQYLGFNLFHLDGLMDTADAFLGSADREKRLAILKDSRAGVYGFFAGFAVLTLKAILLYCLFPFVRDFPALVFAYPLWGRFSAALLPCMAKPLNPGGLGALLKDARPRRCFGGMVLALLLWALLVWCLFRAAALTGLPQFAALRYAGSVLRLSMIAAAISLFAICPLTALFYARLYKKSLGGYTGDALGAAIETAELLCMAAALVIIS